MRTWMVVSVLAQYGTSNSMLRMMLTNYTEGSLPIKLNYAIKIHFKGLGSSFTELDSHWLVRLVLALIFQTQ